MSDFIPYELVKEILLRLPPQSLVKCLSVSKYWRSLITSSSFITARLSRSLSQPPALFLRYFTEQPKTQFFSLNFNPESPLISHNFFASPFITNRNLFYRIVASLHGLVLLSDDLVGIVDRMVVWNPSVNRYILLPKPAAIFRTIGPHFYVLGFGFDSKKNDYKVVRLCYSTESESDLHPPRVEIYSLKAKGWREISASYMKYQMCEREWSQCFMNDCVHWIAYEGKSGQIHNCILIFDVCDERFKRMKFPEDLVHESPLCVFVSEIGGCLAVLHYDFPGEMSIGDRFHYYLGPSGSSNSGTGRNRYCDVWMRKEYGVAKSWTKMYRIEVEGGVESVLHLRASGEFLAATLNGNLVSYDPRSQETKNLGIEGMKESFYAQNYTPSLVLLDEESGAASYGGAGKGCEKHERIEKPASTVSELQEESASPYILVSENDNAELDTRPARRTLDGHKHVVAAFQLTKLKYLRENS